MSFLDTIRNGLSSMVNPARSFLGSLAPFVGGAIGARFGGAGGMGLGSAAGSWLGNLIRGDQGEHSPGAATTNMVNAAVPNQYQNQTFGQMGQGAMNYAGDALNQGISKYIHPGLGASGIGSSLLNSGSSWLSNMFRNSAPNAYASASNYANMTPGQVATNAGNYMNRGINNMNGGMQAAPGMTQNNGMQRPGINQSGPGMSINPGMNQSRMYASGGYVEPMDYNEYSGAY